MIKGAVAVHKGGEELFLCLPRSRCVRAQQCKALATKETIDKPALLIGRKVSRRPSNILLVPDVPALVLANCSPSLWTCDTRKQDEFLLRLSLVLRYSRMDLLRPEFLDALALEREDRA